ncbi:hypothetical protein LHP98_15415 [Rhodobacter sp. Har01]|uniref:glycine zipper domain-containing protein n=1 Tax=Rhodobacter sp. Har01 TaxID=2883999 RepID=UPI001D075ABF|nr:hypothetical protein [Rhodobacter sp. Har01]MCB6179511.1 hypothetical protein [Rhodobacter sp. Har01]
MARKPNPEATATTDRLDDILGALDPATASALKLELARLQAEVADLGKALSGVGQASSAALGEGAKAALDAGRARFAGTQAEIEGFVREKPTRALVTAAGIGMVLGLLLARR